MLFRSQRTRGKRTCPRPFRESVDWWDLNLGHLVPKLILCISQHRPGCAAITNNTQVSVAKKTKTKTKFLMSAICPARVNRASLHHHSVLSQLVNRAAAILDFASSWAEGKRVLEGVVALKCSGPGLATPLTEVARTSCLPHFQL